MARLPVDIPENPADDTKLVQEAKALLQQALALLDKIGPNPDQYGAAFDQAAQPKP